MATRAELEARARTEGIPPNMTMEEYYDQADDPAQGSFAAALGADLAARRDSITERDRVRERIAAETRAIDARERELVTREHELEKREKELADRDAELGRREAAVVAQTADTQKI